MRALGLLLGVFLTASRLPAQDAQDTTPAVRSETGARASYRLAPEHERRAVAYSRARYRLHFAGFAWSLIVLGGVVALRVVPRLRDLAEKRTSRLFAQTALVLAPLGLLQGALELPVHAVRHQLARKYGLSVQTWPSWFADELKGGLIGFLILLPIVWLVYREIRARPRSWWAIVGAWSLPVTTVLVFLAPLVIDPLFFRFTPLEKSRPELVTSIETLTRRAGLEIPRDRVFEMNASSKRRSVNAYVTGFGKSKRVVMWDTTLKQMTEPQALVIFGHEMGHYVLRHIAKGILLSTLLGFALLFLVDRSARWAVARRGERWGIRGLGDLASLPLLAFLLALFTELALPLRNGYSRRVEHNADVFGLEVTRGVIPNERRVAVETFQKLGEINLSDPGPSPFIRFWLYSHPPIAERLEFAARYDPWSRGEPPRFIRSP